MANRRLKNCVLFTTRREGRTYAQGDQVELTDWHGLMHFSQVALHQTLPMVFKVMCGQIVYKTLIPTILVP